MASDQQEQPRTMPQRMESDEYPCGSEDISIGEDSASDFFDHTEDEPITETGLAQKETILVQRSKKVVYFVLFLAATIVATALFLYIQEEESSQFETEFVTLSGEIIAAAETNIDATFSAVKGLSTAWTSYAESTKQAWPFITIPHFEARAQETLELPGAELLVFLPIVLDEDERRWTDYARNNADWIAEGLAFRGLPEVDPGEIPTSIHNSLDDYVDSALAHDPPFTVPVWQVAPAPTNASVVLSDLVSTDWFHRLAHDVVDSRKVQLSKVVDLEWLIQYSRDFGMEAGPRSVLLQPIFDSITGEDSEVVGFVMVVLPWESYFVAHIPYGTGAMSVSVRDTCGSELNYLVRGEKVSSVAATDFNVSDYDHLTQTTEFAEFARFNGTTEENTNDVHCDYTVSVCPTADFEKTYETNEPVIFAVVVLAVFLFTAAVFLVYDCFVQRRQTKVMFAAARTTAVVASLFPTNVRQRILDGVQAEVSDDLMNRQQGFFSHKNRLNQFLREDANMDKSSGGLFYRTRPIADLFVDTTILFADIVGFTAWSSTREPSQVFTLLETIYHEFDEIALRRRVFKVETVGDCYVAAVGLPYPRKDHAVVMARFARDCLRRMQELVKILERKLGPDTADLGMRFGIHSGPVTAGVLRGERARFQLFGDTVNTTARMETTGDINRIHISKETAELLIASGKPYWVRPRAQKIVAKGKGLLQTYWLEMKGEAESGSSSNDGDSMPATVAERVRESQASMDLVTNDVVPRISAKQSRLINWNTDILTKLLKDIVARREAAGVKPDPLLRVCQLEVASVERDNLVLDEVAEIITLPKFDAKVAKNQKSLSAVALEEKVVGQLHDFIQTVSALYRDNAFHNFEHVSHVTMSVTKLLSRIVAPDLDKLRDAGEQTLHDHTYGITSDPLTQFAVVFSALIHDVDHQGVTNSQLVKENSAIAAAYKNKSVAEQNSVDLAWGLLMAEEFTELRRTLYTTQEEFKRFRRLVVNTVMATDIMDKDLGSARKARWNKAFAERTPFQDKTEDTNRKATIVIEHLIQASDVSHTMQHWHVYRKWNARLFEEMYTAYEDGRSDKNPAEGWYEGEMGFFDFYIIPLAKKLKDCGVFGVSSDEYLNYALQNRQEWENRGKEIVAEMVEDLKFSKRSPSPTDSKLEECPKVPALTSLPELNTSLSRVA